MRNATVASERENFRKMFEMLFRYPHSRLHSVLKRLREADLTAPL